MSDRSLDKIREIAKPLIAGAYYKPLIILTAWIEYYKMLMDVAE